MMMFRFMLERYIRSPSYPVSALPANEPVNGLADALAQAVRLHSASSASSSDLTTSSCSVSSPSTSPSSSTASFSSTASSTPSQPESVVLIVVQPGERNSTDQRCIEYALWQRHGIAVLRRSLAEIAARALFTGELNIQSIMTNQWEESNSISS